MMKVIGLTGNFGSGKSTVAWMLQELGATVIDADEIAHEVIAPHTNAWEQVFKYFGKEVMLADGIINRKQLAEIIFRNDKLRKKLHEIIHPRVEDEINHQLAAFRDEGLPSCIVEVPLLFEVHWEEKMDLIVVVRCSEEKAIERAMKKHKMTREEVEIRLKHQFPIERKASEADMVIDNNGPLEETRVQVERLYRAWEKEGTFPPSLTP